MLGLNLVLYEHLNDKSSRIIYNDAEIHYFLWHILTSLGNVTL